MSEAAAFAKLAYAAGLDTGGNGGNGPYFTFLDNFGVNSAAAYNGTAAYYLKSDSATWDYVVATPVPEPSTFIAGALLVIPFAGQGLRSLRRNRRSVSTTHSPTEQP
jgi:hypothetical protein